MTSRRAILAAAATLALLPTVPAGAAQTDFATFLGSVRKDALARGIREATLDRALDGLKPIPRVLELDRKQPESTLSFEQYMARVVSPQRVAAARRNLAENRALLDKVGRRYGVQPRFIVALWGIESDFGRLTGGFPVVGALATLAYDGRRSSFFRGELLAALKILDDGDVTPEAMLGSWAGAMGQSQFMPTSFLRYAVDYTGEGRRDIWGNRADVFASIANYLSQLGWHDGENWGRAVRLPKGFDRRLIGVDTKKTIAEWARLGVRRADGGPLPGHSLPSSIVLPGGADGPALIVYDNYRALLKWNRSLFFASAVGYLADRIDAQ